MDLDERLEDVTVIGAAGKMGSGISVLLASEMAKIKARKNVQCYLRLIDINEEGLMALKKYIRTQLRRIAEKSIVELRNLYANREDLVENWEIIDEFVNNGIDLIMMGSDINSCKKSKMVFEAIIEDENAKIDLFRKLNSICSEDTFFFTNTSSIPIGYLAKESGLDGRLIGYHFYNPPVVQKLVELISSEETLDEIKELSYELGKRLNKKLVQAKDISGFIGNGHWIRESIFAINKAYELKEEYGLIGGIYIVNRVTQEWLIRPMGIFQLIDYVGIDVFNCILNVMRKHLKDESLHSDLIDELISKKVLGGQYPDGSQKNGFFKYEKGKIIGIYDKDKNNYIPIEDIKIDIGNPPEGYIPWKAMIKEVKREDLLSTYFNNVKKDERLGSKLAIEFLQETKRIAKKLVEDGVAEKEEDVNAVLLNGFYWVYGPINNYV